MHTIGSNDVLVCRQKPLAGAREECQQKMRKSFYAIGAASVLASTVLGATSATAAPVNHANHPRTAAGQQHAVATSASSSEVGDAINLIGITKFPASFGGVYVNDSKNVTVYVKKRQAGLMRAIAAAARPTVAIRVVQVPRSYQQLESLTTRMARDAKNLTADGVSMQSWGPEAQTDKVRVTLVTPSHMTRAAADSQVISEKAKLQETYGTGWITVANSTEPMARTAATRDNDVAPYFAGNAIALTNIGVACTEGWGTTGNNSGKSFILTAGHCGPGDVFLEFGSEAKIGDISTQYLDATTGDERDFETIGGSSVGDVWFGAKGSSSSDSVAGPTIPAEGSQMAFDGDVSKQVTNNIVGLPNECESVTDDHYGTYEVCGMGNADNNASSQPVICQPGDSGGPAYVRQGTSLSVKAAGTIVSDNTQGHDCFFQEIETEMSTANVHLDIG